MAPFLQVFKAFIQSFGDMGDIEYLAIKTFDGKTRSTYGSATATGDIVTLTATSGKDMYKAKAWVVGLGSTGVATYTGSIVLKANGTTMETWDYLVNSGTLTAAVNGTAEHEFEWAAKVTSTQIMKLELASHTNGNVKGFLEVFEETSGDTPAV